MLITRKNRSPSKQILAKLMFQFPTRRHFKNCYITCCSQIFKQQPFAASCLKGLEQIRLTHGNDWKDLNRLGPF